MASLHRNRFPREFAVDRAVGRRIRMARVERGWRLADLAEKIGLSSAQLSQYETAGHRVTVSRLATISKVFGKPTTWFLEGVA